MENSSPGPLIIERTFDAPIAEVWRALTDADVMRRWHFDLREFKPEVGFEFEFTVEHEGMVYRHLCQITEVSPQRKLAYTWRYDGHPGDSLVTFELSTEAGKTKLNLTHDGLESFPPLPSFARKNVVEGWTQLIGSSLKDYLANAPREIVVTREFAAPRELVWEAMTNPKHVVSWWGPRGFTTTIETMDFRVGGVWKHVMRGPDGTNYPNKSVFKEIVKPERVVYSHGGGREGGPGASFIATWTFDALDPERTRATVQMVFPSATERELVVKEFGAIEDGQQTLMRLGEHLAEALSEPFVISREFAAPREAVWKAWTERENLMQWFGPKGCTIPVATLDFRVGGQFHYCMRTADGKEMWGKWIFREIVVPEKIVLANSFSDKDGGTVRPPFPGIWPLQMLTKTTFTEHNGKTTVTLRWLPLDATPEERKTFDQARGSFNQGWTGTLINWPITWQSGLASGKPGLPTLSGNQSSPAALAPLLVRVADRLSALDALLRTAVLTPGVALRARHVE